MSLKAAAILLLLVMLGFSDQTTCSFLTVGDVEGILQTQRRANISDVVERQFLYSFKSSGTEQLLFNEFNSSMSQFLFATITPCTAPVAVEFAKLRVDNPNAQLLTPVVVSNYLFDSNKGNDTRRMMSYISSRRTTYKLDTRDITALSLQLMQFTGETPDENTMRAQDIKMPIHLSNRYPDLELGATKYNMQICAKDPETQPEMLSAKLQAVLDAPANLRDYQLCLVVNRVRPLREYCAAQVALSNKLPSKQDRILIGRAVKTLQLRAGDFAYSCGSFPQARELWNSPPTVNVSQLLDTDPAVLFVNAFLLKPPTELGAQPEASAWETVRYYRRDPAAAADPSARRPLAPVRCGSGQFASEGRAKLVKVAPGKFRAELSIQLPPDASLLVRPSRLVLVGSAFKVQIAPYSGQSESFEKLAESGSLSCSDAVWGYGGMVCGRFRQHRCLPGDESACMFDSVRLIVSLDHKFNALSAKKYSYQKKERPLTVPHEIRLQFVRRLQQHGYDNLEPMIGRVSEIAQVQRHLTGMSMTSSRARNNSKFEENRLREQYFRKQLSDLSECDMALKQPTFNGTTDELIRRTSKCYRRLLEMTTHVHIRCSHATAMMVVAVAWPATSSSAPVYSPSSNAYYCLVFEVAVQEKPNPRGNMAKILRTMRWLRTRLLKSVSTIDLPSPENQGFGNGTQYDEVNKDAKGRRQIVKFELLHREWSPAGTENPLFEANITPTLEALERNPRYFAVYLFASPNREHRRQRPSLSLVAFRLAPLTRSLLKMCQEVKIHVLGIVDDYD